MQKKCDKSKYAALCLTGILIFCAVLFLQQKSFAAWKESEQGKMYEDENGTPVTGFYEIEGQLYHFSKQGYLETGKFYDEEKAAYFYSDGDGVVQTGTVETEEGFYVTDETGIIQTGFLEYQGNRYYFAENAEMVTGWFQVSGDWYYADDSGIVMTGFLELSGYRYYLDANGVRICDQTMEIDGVCYVFNADGSVDENATLLYDVYQYLQANRAKNPELGTITQSAKVQACAILRASELVEGYQVTEETDIEILLKNRGVMCQGGYEFSYGGIPGYDVDRLLVHLEKDVNFQNVLKNPDVKEVGLGVHEEGDIYYFDFIFTK